METLWFMLIVFMLTAYVVLDGFDLGAGMINHLVAPTPDERRLVLRSIGPVWSGNEVWLLATGGALFFAFPALFASSFSGFYLPLTMVLWLLMGRGVGLELRSHIDDPLWWSACDFVFSLSSFLLVLFFGVAMGNVVRGVPLDAEGYFFEPLWTDFRVGPRTGILDWYTVLTGLLATAALAIHGANYLAMKTEGSVQARARSLAVRIWWVLLVLTAAAFAGTLAVRGWMELQWRPSGWAITALVGASLVGMRYYQAKQRDGAAFLASSAYIVMSLAGAAFAIYPNLLPAIDDPANNLTIHNTKTGAYALRVGLIWWLVGCALAAGYFFFLYRSFRGKVTLAEEDHGASSAGGPP